MLILLSASVSLVASLELAYIQLMTRHGARTNYHEGFDPLHTDYSPLQLHDLTPVGMR